MKKLVIITLFSLALTSCAGRIVQAFITGVEVGRSTYERLDSTPTPSGHIDGEYSDTEGL